MRSTGLAANLSRSGTKFCFRFLVYKLRSRIISRKSSIAMLGQVPSLAARMSYGVSHGALPKTTKQTAEQRARLTTVGRISTAYPSPPAQQKRVGPWQPCAGHLGTGCRRYRVNDHADNRHRPWSDFVAVRCISCHCLCLKDRRDLACHSKSDEAAPIDSRTLISTGFVDLHVEWLTTSPVGIQVSRH